MIINTLAFLAGAFSFPLAYGLYRAISHLREHKSKKQMNLQEYKAMITPRDGGRSLDDVVEKLKESCLPPIRFELPDPMAGDTAD